MCNLAPWVRITPARGAALLKDFMSTNLICPHRVICSVSHALWDTDLIASRIVLAFSAFFWGLLLMWPGHVFDRAVYSNMSFLAGEETWGCLFLMTFFAQAFIVLSGNLHNKFARCFAAYSALLWCFVVSGMLIAVYPPPAAIGGEVAIAVVSFWIWIRPYILAEGYERAGHP